MDFTHQKTGLQRQRSRVHPAQPGLSLLEIMIVMVVMGVMLAMGYPRLRTAFLKQNVRSARVNLATLAAKSRAAAVQRGCRSVLHITSGANGAAWVTVCKAGSSGLDTLGGVDALASRYGVALTASRDSVQYDSRGLSLENLATTVLIQAAEFRDSVMINPLGKVVSR